MLLLPRTRHAIPHRYLLAASGLVAACYAEHRVEKPLVVRQGKELYVGLDLMALPEAVRQGYVAVGVEVEAEGHDQVGRAGQGRWGQSSSVWLT